MQVPCSPNGNDHGRGGQRLGAAILLAMAFVVAGATSGAQARIESPAVTQGNLEPCACPKNPQGGLARRTGFLRGAAQPVRSRAGTALVLDAGGFFPEGEVPLRNDPAVASRLTALLLDALARSGAQAWALNHVERDFLEQTAPREARRLREVFLEADPPGTPRVINWGTHRVAIVASRKVSPMTRLASPVQSPARTGIS